MSQFSAEPATATLASGIVGVYRITRKPDDVPFNTYVCRPLAAVVVYGLRGTRVAPNQVTFFSLLLAWAAAACLTAIEWPLGLWLGVAVFEVSYVFDKVDGMLARSRGVQSPTGHLLDFLMDEIKAFSIVAAMAVGAYLHTGQVAMLLWGLVGVVCLASGIGITTFQRRPEVLAAAAAARAMSVAPVAGLVAEGARPVDVAEGARAPVGDVGRAPSKSELGSAVRLAEKVGRFFIHYPSYIWLAAVFGDARVYLYPYVMVNALYCARSMLGLVLVYGGPVPRSVAGAARSAPK
jgi:phosphatidylglycerophosphate synthase